MKANTKRFLVVILAIGSFSVLKAQDPPMKWGEISKDDLAMKSFPADTNAAAVILCDFGQSFFNDDMELVFKRHVRVKILSTRGYVWATRSILADEKKDRQRVDDIEGITYSLGENGEIVKKELDSDDIFKEKVEGDLYRYRFTLPGLAPGCIVDIRYTIYSQSIYDIQDWTFQRDEPVLWSEYRLINPKSIAYSAVMQGYEKFAAMDQQDVNLVFSGTASSYFGKNPVACNQYRWVVKNAPAIREEPFITTTGDYVNRIDLQLAGYALAGQMAVHVLGTWADVVKERNDSKYFGERIDQTGDVKDLTKKVTEGLASPEDKLKAIYSWVSSSIVWNNSLRRYAELDVDEVLKAKKGNDAEIAFLLISMLRSAEIQADPVIVSTRSNGKIQEMYPIVSQFDYVLARAVIGSTTYYLDATDPLRPYTILPTRVLNVKGLVIREGNVEWVTIVSRYRSRQSSVATLTLNPDGSFHGTIGSSCQDYAALRLRQNLKEKKDVDILKDEFRFEPAGIVVDSASVEGKDSLTAPVVLKGWISSNTYAQVADSLIYLNPQVLDRFTDNPFKLSNRKYPVDYSYARSQNSVVTIELPDSFEVREVPPTRSFSLSSDASFLREFELQGRVVQMREKLDINNIEIPPERYRGLRDFYANIVALESEQLVLHRIKAPPPPPKPEPKKVVKKTRGKGK